MEYLMDCYKMKLNQIKNLDEENTKLKAELLSINLACEVAGIKRKDTTLNTVIAVLEKWAQERETLRMYEMNF